MRRQDLTGFKFGKLSVVDFSHKNGKHLYWNCLCDCGNESNQCTTNLKRGNVQSCGCVRNKKSTERIKEIGPTVKYAKGIASANVLYGEYKHRAKKRGWEFSLTKEEFNALTSKNCHYCGGAPKNTITRNRCNGEYVYNGIDRVNTKLGYTIENSITCCGICNKMKLDHSLIDFLIHIEMIYEHIQDKNLIGTLGLTE